MRNDSTKRKSMSKKMSGAPQKPVATKKGKSSMYNQFMNAKLAELKKSEPTMEHRERMKIVQDAWKIETGVKKVHAVPV